MIENNKAFLYYIVFFSSNANLWYQYPTLGSWLRLIAASKSVRSSSIWDNPTLATTSLPFITEVVNSFVYSAAGRLERKQFQSYQYLLHLCEMIRKSCTNLKNSFHRQNYFCNYKSNPFNLYMCQLFHSKNYFPSYNWLPCKICFERYIQICCQKQQYSQQPVKCTAQI